MENRIEKTNKFIDDLRDKFQIKSDRQLAKLIGAVPSNFSRIRSGHLPFGPTYILATHEVFEIPIKEIKERING